MLIFDDYNDFVKGVKKHFPNAKDYPNAKDICKYSYIILHLNTDEKMMKIVEKHAKNKEINEYLPVYCLYNETKKCEEYCWLNNKCKKSNTIN